MKILRLEINGRPATVDQLAYPAIVNYGHFTAMQVRGAAVRGLGLHLARLDSATRELFGPGLDGGRVREHIRHALGTGILDASVRVGVFREDSGEPPSIMVVLRPPAPQPSVPQRLTAVSYLRPVARIKHVGTFAQIYHGEAAERAGYDDALLTGLGDVISESTISNIGFFDGNAVIWPSALSLEGITMQLVSTALAERGIPFRRETVRVAGWQFDTSSPAAEAVSEPTDYGFVDRVTTPDGTGIPGGIGGGARYPAHVVFYVGVPNVEAALAKAERLGGKRRMGPERAPTGLVVGHFTDPEGNLIGVAGTA